MADALTALFHLADGRFPVGGHVHSAGIEAAIADGLVRTVEALERFVVGRLQTSGLVDASLAAATVVHLERGDELLATLGNLDAEADARFTVTPLREASRRQGRQLLRVAGRCWPAPALAALAEVDPAGPHVSVATGAVVAALSGSPREAALLTLHHCVTTPIQAALRLAGLDPYELAALATRFGPMQDELAGSAVVHASGALDQLPALTGPLTEIGAVAHATRPHRLFAT